MHDKMPKKQEASGLLEDQIDYSKKLIKLIKDDGRFEKLQTLKNN